MQTLSRIKLYILLLSGIFGPIQLLAQQNQGWKDYNYVKQSDAWFTSENAAGLNRLSVDNISKAEINFQKNDGDFVNYDQSNDSYNAGANVESLYRLNPKVVFFGKVGYNLSEGKNMAGSVFMNTERLPFNIVEYSYENAGSKKKEVYNVVGAVSAEVYKGLALGAKIDFLAANYAKDKDLRHKNNMSDILFTAGASYRISKLFELGANYYYRRSVEGIDIKVYGIETIQYSSLIDYGAFFGKKEIYNGGGFSDTGGKERPLVDQFHGGTLQLGVDFTSRINLHNEFSYKSREGQFGKSGTTSIVFSEHMADILEYRGKLNLKDRNNLHSLDINLMSEKLKNNKTVYTIEKEVGEFAQRVIYYDPIRIGEKQFYNVGLAYTANLGIDDYNPIWILKGGYHFCNRQQLAYLYPYYREQSVDQSRVFALGERNIMKGLNMYTIRLGLDYQWGSGVMAQDGMFSEPEGEFIEASINSDYLNREYEYMTASQIRGDIGFKYSRLFPKIRMKGYAALNYNLTKAFDVKRLAGDSFNKINLTVGCTF